VMILASLGLISGCHGKKYALKIEGK